jgi:hypothetical protein
LAGKSDYAGNIGGDFAGFGTVTAQGPKTLAEITTHNWECSGDGFVLFNKRRYPAFDGMTGVIFQRSEIKIRQITDGTTYTYLLGEKNQDPNHYDDGAPLADDQSMYNGYDKDNLRAADVWLPGLENQPPIHPPVPDTPGSENKFEWQFGGPHPGGWIAAFCDNSVRFLSYDMKLELHQNFGNRKDGRVTNLGDL